MCRVAMNAPGRGQTVRDLVDRAQSDLPDAGQPTATPKLGVMSEVLILSNRRILADQMAFLLARVPERSRLRQSDECGTSGKRS